LSSRALTKPQKGGRKSVSVRSHPYPFFSNDLGWFLIEPLFRLEFRDFVGIFGFNGAIRHRRDRNPPGTPVRKWHSVHKPNLSRKATLAALLKLSLRNAKI
jgi:hypothetical protein